MAGSPRFIRTGSEDSCESDVVSCGTLARIRVKNIERGYEATPHRYVFLQAGHHKTITTIDLQRTSRNMKQRTPLPWVVAHTGSPHTYKNTTHTHTSSLDFGMAWRSFGMDPGHAHRDWG